jgi:hypothetical protein
MRKTFISLAVAALAVMFAAAPASAASDREWHRLNPDQSNPAPEHELLSCVRGTGILLCQYSKVRGGGYHWDRTVGRFKGEIATHGWKCPDWFPGDVCDNVVKVWSGHARYWPASGDSFRVRQQMIIVDWNGQKVMFQYWVDQFACPWFKTFEEAVAANPGEGFDCIVP